MQTNILYFVIEISLLNNLGAILVIVHASLMWKTEIDSFNRGQSICYTTYGIWVWK